jgi:hypothetical protein
MSTPLFGARHDFSRRKIGACNRLNCERLVNDVAEFSTASHNFITDER